MKSYPLLHYSTIQVHGMTSKRLTDITINSGLVLYSWITEYKVKSNIYNRGNKFGHPDIFNILFLKKNELHRAKTCLSKSNWLMLIKE